MLNESTMHETARKLVIAYFIANVIIEENYTRNLSQYGKIQTQGTQNTE